MMPSLSPYRASQRVRHLVVILALSTITSAMALGQAGQLDMEFGSGGVALITVPELFAYGQSVLVLPDGNILVGGAVRTSLPSEAERRGFALTRLSAVGDLDKDFGSDGIVTTNVTDFNQLYDLALQPDGKVVACGITSGVPQGQDLVVLRYMPDGTLDTTFDDDGVVRVDLGGTEIALSIALQDDGKIVLAGLAIGINEMDPQPSVELMVGRFLADGQVDESFANQGFFRGALGFERAQGNEVVVQADGSIVVVGDAYQSDPLLRKIVALRLDDRGVPDTKFGNAGVAVPDFAGGREFGTALGLQRDGRILIGGQTERIPGGFDFDIALARLNHDGTLDLKFADEGIVKIDLGTQSDAVSSIRIQKNGRILLGGWASSVMGTACVGPNRGADCDLALVRLKSNGKLDPNFGNQGWVTTDISGNWDQDFGMALDSNDGVFLAGTSSSAAPAGFPASDSSAIAVVRYELKNPGGGRP